MSSFCFQEYKVLHIIACQLELLKCCFVYVQIRVTRSKMMKRSSLSRASSPQRAAILPHPILPGSFGYRRPTYMLTSSTTNMKVVYSILICKYIRKGMIFSLILCSFVFSLKELSFILLFSLSYIHHIISYKFPKTFLILLFNLSKTTAICKWFLWRKLGHCQYNEIYRHLQTLSFCLCVCLSHFNGL